MANGRRRFLGFLSKSAALIVGVPTLTSLHTATSSAASTSITPEIADALKQNRDFQQLVQTLLHDGINFNLSVPSEASTNDGVIFLSFRDEAATETEAGFLFAGISATDFAVQFVGAQKLRVSSDSAEITDYQVKNSVVEMATRHDIIRPLVAKTGPSDNNPNVVVVPGDGGSAPCSKNCCSGWNLRGGYACNGCNRFFCTWQERTCCCCSNSRDCIRQTTGQVCTANGTCCPTVIV